MLPPKSSSAAGNKIPDTEIESLISTLDEALIREERLRLALECAKMGSYHWAAKDNEIIWSDNFRKIFGLSSDIPPTYENWLTTVLPEDREEVLKQVNRAMDNHDSFDSEYRISWVEGTVHWVNAKGRFLYSDSGMPVRMEGIVCDITDRKAMEERLLFTQASVDNTSDGIIWIRNDMRILEANDAACRDLGYNREELSQLTIRDFNQEHDLETIRNNLAEVKKAGSLTFETMHRRKDSSLTPVEVTLTHVQIGSEDRFCAAIRDLSERKKREDELCRLREDAEAANNRLEEANTALKVLLSHQEEEKKHLAETVVANIEKLILPYLKKLKTNKPPESQALLEILEKNLEKIVLPYLPSSYLKTGKLSPQEILVSNLISQGKKDKEIAELLNSSINTIKTHRRKIRKKLELTGKKANLTTHLNILQNDYEA